MVSNLEDLISVLNAFDTIFFVITIFSVIQCFLKGFTLSLISFMKWIIAIISTIIFTPKLQPWVSEYIESEFINNIGIGIAIFIVTLFLQLL